MSDRLLGGDCTVHCRRLGSGYGLWRLASLGFAHREGPMVCLSST